MTFGIWQVLWLCLMVAGLFVCICKNGEPRGPYNAGSAFVAFLIEFAIVWAGGFFG